jgi:hypothetical protein
MKSTPALVAVAFAISGCGAAVSLDALATPAGRADASSPPLTDGGTGATDAGGTDGGSPDLDGGTSFQGQITYTETGYDLLAVDSAGTAYGVNLNGSGAEIWSGSDGRAWQKRGSIASGASFWNLAPLVDKTLLADVVNGKGHAVARSTDRGVTWTEVLATGAYRSLSPHSFAELDGAVYFLEYQVFTAASTPIRLWRSSDRGATWAVQHTFEGHRHGHGMVPDPARHTLWAFFGDTDPQSGTYRSTDGGASWTAIVAGSQDGDLVDAALLPDGSLLCGQDISYRGSTPDRPQIARIALNGTVTHILTLPSASYSTHAVRSGGYLVGTTYELDSDVSPAGWTRGSLWGSVDGWSWEKLLDVPQLDSKEDVRTDVYWELASGEQVVSVRNAAGFGPGGRGYMLLRLTRR